MDTLLQEIEAFCRTHGVRESRFGRDAVNDTNFVPQLRAGRRLWPETAAKVRLYMASYQASASERDAA